MRRTWALAGLVVALALGVSGCVAIPTSGPVTQVSVSPNPTADDPIDINPLPPAAGAAPSAILEGFMAAESSSSATRFDIARLYLTADAASTWDPNQGAQIYQSTGHPPITTVETATVQAPLIGKLDAAGHFTSVYQAGFSHDFGMVQVKGEWRISNPGPGILLPEYLYDRYYVAVPVYFLSMDGSRVVPELIHLNQVDATPTGMIQALLRGPSSWLSSAVQTVIPAETKLSAPSVTVDDDGVAQVSLTEQIDGLNDQQRLQLAAQVLWSLSDFAAIWGVHITDKGAPFVIPGQDADGVVSRASVASYLPADPGSRSVFAVADGALGQLNETTGSVTAVSGPLGKPDGAAQLGAIAVSADQSVLAAVDPDGAQLTVGSLTEPPTVPHGLQGTGFVRPQVDTAHNVWDFSRGATAPVLTRCDAAVCVQVSVASLAGWTVTAFRISPDHTKIAVIASDGAASQFGLLRLRVSDQVVADGWVPLLVTSTRGALDDYRDVVWASDTQLLVLAESSSDGYASAYLMDADGSQVESYGPSSDVDAIGLTAVPLNNSGPVVMLLTGSGRIDRFDDPTRWTQLSADKVTAVAYAG